MSYSVSFRMGDEDFKRLLELNYNEVIRFQFCGSSVVGRLDPSLTRNWPNQMVTAKIWPDHLGAEPLITIPLDVDRYGFDLQDDPVTRTEVYYGISGDSFVSTQYSRERYRKLANLRKRQESLTLCVTPESHWDDWEGEYVMCGHDPHRHDENGCKEYVWYSDGGSRCGCEAYTKPAPLARTTDVLL